MTEQVKVLVTGPENLSSNPVTYMVEGKIEILQVVF